MSRYGELFPGRKLQHEGDQGGVSREHDPGGPLDLDGGVVFLAPPEQPRTGDQDDTGQDDVAGPASDRTARESQGDSGSA